MKKSTLLFVLSILFSISAIAYQIPGRSVLELKLWDNSKFSVVIDHQSYPANVRHFRVENLRAGVHSIKVIKRTQRPNGFISQVVFRGTVRIKARSKITAKITRQRTFEIIRIRPLIHSQFHHGVNSHHGQYDVHGVNGNGSSGVNSHGSMGGYEYIGVMSDYNFDILKHTIMSRLFD